MRYAKGIADADINITGPRKLGAALQVDKRLEGLFCFFGSPICGIASLREYGGRNVWANMFLPVFVFNAAPVLDGLRCAMFNIQENQEEVV